MIRGSLWNFANALRRVCISLALIGARNFPIPPTHEMEKFPVPSGTPKSPHHISAVRVQISDEVVGVRLSRHIFVTCSNAAIAFSVAPLSLFTSPGCTKRRVLSPLLVASVKSRARRIRFLLSHQRNPRFNFASA